MFYHTEAKPQCWRAVAEFDDRPNQLIFLNRSSTQVRAGYAEVSAYYLSFADWAADESCPVRR